MDQRMDGQRIQVQTDRGQDNVIIEAISDVDKRVRIMATLRYLNVGVPGTERARFVSFRVSGDDWPGSWRRDFTIEAWKRLTPDLRRKLLVGLGDANRGDRGYDEFLRQVEHYASDRVAELFAILP